MDRVSSRTKAQYDQNSLKATRNGTPAPLSCSPLPEPKTEASLPPGSVQIQESNYVLRITFVSLLHVQYVAGKYKCQMVFPSSPRFFMLQSPKSGVDRDCNDTGKLEMRDTKSN